MYGENVFVAAAGEIYKKQMQIVLFHHILDMFEQKS